MVSIKKTILEGKWKSFKTFKKNGVVVLNNQQQFSEFHFDANGLLFINSYTKEGSQKLVKTDQWSLQFRDRRHYLTLPQEKLEYEVITVNHSVLVLMDPVNLEKIFLAREAHWSHFLESNRQIVL